MRFWLKLQANPPSTQALSIIAEAEAAGGKVLVHCHEGKSRSAALAEQLAFLFWGGWLQFPRKMIKTSTRMYTDTLKRYRSPRWTIGSKLRSEASGFNEHFEVLGSSRFQNQNLTTCISHHFTVLWQPAQGICVSCLLGLRQTDARGRCLGLRQIQAANCTAQRGVSQAAPGF